MTPNNSKRVRLAIEEAYFSALNYWLCQREGVTAMRVLATASVVAKEYGLSQVQDALVRVSFAISDNEDTRQFVWSLKQMTAQHHGFAGPLRCLMGWLLIQLKDYPMALRVLARSLEDTPFYSVWESHHAMGLANLYSGNLSAARDSLLKAVAHHENPHPDAAWQLLGETYWRMGDNEEAETSFLKAMESVKDPYRREYLRLKLADIHLGAAVRMSSVIPIDVGKSFDNGIERFLEGLLEDKLIGPKNSKQIGSRAQAVADDYEIDIKSRLYLERFGPQIVAELARQARDLRAGVHRGRLLEEQITRQRQYLTVLKISMHGFTAHFKYLDPEDQLKFINRFLARIADIVFRFNGALDRIQPTNVMAYFGMMADGSEPSVHRMAAADALRAAFEIQDELITFFKEIKKHFFELPVEKIRLEKGGYDLRERTLGLAIGLSTGWCVFGEMSVGDKNGRLMVGHTVNIAHRLTEVARPREILTSQTTYDLVSRVVGDEFLFEDITSTIEIQGEMMVKTLKDYENRPIYRITQRDEHPPNETDIQPAKKKVIRTRA
jgi:class 3 adenylate cyclase